MTPLSGCETRGAAIGNVAGPQQGAAAAPVPASVATALPVPYVNVSGTVALGGDAAAREQERTTAAIASALAASACGLVVDLRTHGGGNMWPTLAGMARCWTQVA